MDYKKIIKKPGDKTKILSLFNFIPDKQMVKLQYRIKTGRKLDLKNPIRYTEKIQWYKLNARNPIMHSCVDKYDVRNYIREKGYSELLTECYGVYEKVADIKFESLPDRFVMKKTNGGGGLNVLICKDKSTLKREKVRLLLDNWLKATSKRGGGREWAYYGLKSKIIIEEYLENEENPDASINDYKIFCFNGKAKFFVVDIDRYVGHKRNFYDLQWNDLHIVSDCPAADREIPKPKNFSSMLQIAEALAKDFKHVRVDLYNINGKIYFSELTFYPWSGYVQFLPDRFDFELGKAFTLSEVNVERYI